MKLKIFSTVLLLSAGVNAAASALDASQETSARSSPVLTQSNIKLPVLELPVFKEYKPLSPPPIKYLTIELPVFTTYQPPRPLPEPEPTLELPVFAPHQPLRPLPEREPTLELPVFTQHKEIEPRTIEYADGEELNRLMQLFESSLAPVSQDGKTDLSEFIAQ